MEGKKKSNRGRYRGPSFSAVAKDPTTHHHKHQHQLQTSRLQSQSQLQSSSSSSSSSSSHDTNKNSDKDEALLCSICADFVSFYAVGACDHNICSTCSLRLRTKDVDKNCPICKQTIEYVICYRADRGIQLFASFNTMGLDAHIPGFDIDHVSGMMFAHCHAHYKSLVSLRSICCPVRGCDVAVGESFRSTAALLHHMKSRHDVSFCTLCLEKRSLFISEHILYNASQLKKHMTASQAGGHGGHPPCHFCQKHFYDSPQLYRHMHTAHTTCHLCPSQFQHRFYRNAQSLLDHTRDSHIVCSYCTNEDVLVNGVEYAFRTVAELQTHLMQVHRVSSGAGSKINLAVGFKASHREVSHEAYSSTTDTNFLDFDWSSSDPNQGSFVTNRTDEEGARHQQGTTSTFRGQDVRRSTQISAASVNELASLVPSNMRIAGRVSGAGLFHYTKDDQALQAALEEASSRRRVMPSGPRPKTADETVFPELGQQGLTSSQTGNTEPTVPLVRQIRKTSNQVSNVAPSHHLNSIMNSVAKPGPTPSKYKRIPEPMETTLSAENEVKPFVFEVKVARNTAFAQALGIPTAAPIDSVVHSEEVVTTLSLDCPEPPLEVCCMCIPSLLRGEPDEFARRWAFLDKPLFLPLLVNMVKVNKDEIKKVEKKMQDLVETKGSSSSQLKPMPGSLRHAVCALARFYGLNAYEFDFDPRRYVSLVKSPESCAPVIRLSSAASSCPIDAGHLVLSLQSPSPVLYISMRDSAYYYSPLDDSDLELSAYASTAPSHRVFIASDLLLYVCKILYSDRSIAKMCKIADVKLACPTAIAISFQDVSAALCAFRVLSAQSVIVRKVGTQESSTTRKPKGSSSTVSVTLTDLFQLLPAFDPVDPGLTEALAQRIEAEAVKRDYIAQQDTPDGNTVAADNVPAQVNQMSSADWLALKGMTRGSTAASMNETQKHAAVLDANLVANIQSEWEESDTVADDFVIVDKKKVTEKEEEVSSGDEKITDTNDDASGVNGKEEEEISCALTDLSSDKFTSSTGGYKRLILQPRSSDLPTLLPPMPTAKKHAAQVDNSAIPRQKTVKAVSLTSENDKKEKSTVMNKFAALSAVGDEESDSDEGGGGDFPDPCDVAPASLDQSSVDQEEEIANSEVESNDNVQLSEVVSRTWTCAVCTLDNSLYVPKHQHEVECDACLTKWRPSP